MHSSPLAVNHYLSHTCPARNFDQLCSNDRRPLTSSHRNAWPCWKLLSRVFSRLTSSQNVVLVRCPVALKAVDQWIFQLFSELAEKVAYARSSPNWQPGEHSPLSWRCATIQRHGHLRTTADSITQSTHHRHWQVADVTAPTPCRRVTRVWLVAASTVCRHPVVTPQFIRRADRVNGPSWRVTGFHYPSTRAVLTGARFH